LAPAFTASHIKSLTPIFFQKAEQLRDIWLQQLQVHNSDPITNEKQGIKGPRIDVLGWLSRATLDIIGLTGHSIHNFCAYLLTLVVTGFGYTFNSLSPASTAKEPLADAFRTIFSVEEKFEVINVLRIWVPFLRRFVS